MDVRAVLSWVADVVLPVVMINFPRGSHALYTLRETRTWGCERQFVV